MGIFNVILAVYVDITMRAAKENDVNSAEQYARESIRVARCARELLKRFATAYRELSDADQGPSAMDMMSSMEFTSNRAGVFTDDDVHDQIEISKELFLVVIQDRGLAIQNRGWQRVFLSQAASGFWFLCMFVWPCVSNPQFQRFRAYGCNSPELRGVQQLMDELDLPPDRANMSLGLSPITSKPVGGNLSELIQLASGHGLKSGSLPLCLENLVRGPVRSSGFEQKLYESRMTINIPQCLSVAHCI